MNAPKTRNWTRATVGLLAVAALLTGCGKKDEHSEHDGHDHAGHKHAHAKPSEAKGPVCAAHNAPKELCFICDASLREKGRLWCNEHGRYEDRCWLCRPDAQDKKRAYCDEHFLYEDECFLCRPELKGARPEGRGTGQKDPAPHAPQAATLFCNEHGVPEAECGICRPELAGKLKPGEGMKVRLPAAESAAIVGVRTASPEAGAIGDGVECLAEVSFNQNKLAQIVAPVAGIIQTVEADLGAKVEEKQVVARLWSASVAEAVAKAVLSHQVLDRERKLRAQRVTSEKDLQEAEAAHRAACQQLRLLGFSEEQVDAMGAKPQEAVLLDVRAPFAGEIVERAAVCGAMVEAGKPLFTVADRTTMWANLNIPETALASVQVGQSVELTVDALPGRTFTGKLTWIGPAVDDRTRMARARAEVANPNGELRDKMFARARIITRRAQSALLLPASAIVRVEGNPLVFVKVADDLFEARAVRLGARFNGRQEVLGVLKPDEQVVVAHGFAIKSQLLISRLGAGCVDD